MSWSQRQEQQSHVLVTAQTLEERINMYISAMDTATAMNNGHQSSQLQQDIQRLVDLMERISAGQTVMEQEVPPPLIITSQIDVLANPLGELSSRLAEYHKALYFAEEELSEDRMNKIQRLQRGLQTIHELQKRTQAGFPVRVDEIPPPVTIPSDDEFDPDAVATLNSRLESYRTALSAASQSESDRRRVPKLQSIIRNTEFLLTRAKAKRPVWKKDIPPEYEYSLLDSAQPGAQPLNKTKFILQLKSLQKRAQNINFKEKDYQKHLDELKKKLHDYEAEIPKKQTLAELDSCLTSFKTELENIEKLAFAEKTKDLNSSGENLDLIEIRLNEYKAAALASKRDGQVNHAIQHYKIVKGLQSLKDALEKGEPVDMTLVPPPPREFTPTSESHPPLAELNKAQATEAPPNPVGATAHLTPVIIKPAVESSEDKLAKKLFSYLDNGADFSLSTSKQILNIHQIDVSPAQCLPKIQNTEAKEENIVPASSNSDASSNNAGSEINEADSSPLSIDNCIEEVKDGSLSGSNFVQSFSSNVDDEAAESTNNNSSQNESYPKINNEPGQGVQEKQQHNEEIKEEAEEETDSAPPKSSELYVRKTLDTVGFLPCQNVPDHSAQPQSIVLSSDSVNLDSSSASSELGTLQQQNVDISSDTIDNLNHLDSSSPDCTNLQIQPDSSAAVTMGALTNNLHSVTLEQSANNGIPNYLSDVRNESSHSGPSSITLPIYGSDIFSNNLDSGPSSLPITLIPEHINGSAHLLTEDTDTALIRNSTIDFAQKLIHGQKQERNVTYGIEKNTSVIDSLTSEITNSKQDESNGRTSPDTLEFLDLMDSMAMPSIVAPISLSSINSSPGHLPVHLNEHRETSLSSHKQRVISEQTASHSEASVNSGNFVSDTTAFIQNDGSTIPPFASSYTQPHVDEVNRNVITGDDKINLPFTSRDASISSNGSQDFLHTNNFPFVSELPEHHQNSTQSSDINSTVLGSRVLVQNFLNGSLSRTPAAYSQPPNHQSQNFTQASSLQTQASVSLSKSVSSSAARPASAFTYSDVAFTCLENLKYDCLLSLAKDTDESKQEEKKLRAKFDLIKNKLRHGGKRTWEVYKACVEREHASLIQQIEDLCLLQQWSDVQILSEKKNIAERELVILRDRLPEIKY